MALVWSLQSPSRHLSLAPRGTPADDRCVSVAGSVVVRQSLTDGSTPRLPLASFPCSRLIFLSVSKFCRIFPPRPGTSATTARRFSFTVLVPSEPCTAPFEAPAATLRLFRGSGASTPSHKQLGSPDPSAAGTRDLESEVEGSDVAPTVSHQSSSGGSSGLRGGRRGIGVKATGVASVEAGVSPFIGADAGGVGGGKEMGLRVRTSSRSRN